MTIIVLLIISVIVSNAVIPVHNNLTSYAENMRNNMISKTEGNRYKYVSVKNYNNYESMNFKGTVLVSHRELIKLLTKILFLQLKQQARWDTGV